MAFHAGTAAAFEPGRPVAAVTDNATLRALEDGGFGFGRGFGGPGTASNDTLNRDNPAYRHIVTTISDDVRQLRREIEASGRRLLEITDDNVGRVFELAWLASPAARFRLVGLVTRFDRRDFLAEDLRDASCGELRLIYRLAYRFERAGRTYASRMPFSINVVFDLPRPAGTACPDMVSRFVPPEAMGDPRARAAWLAAGPLAASGVRPKQIEINAQVVRFPSGLETTFGGQAAYVMRIFGVAPGEGAPVLFDKALENTPDMARLGADAALRAELVAFLAARGAAIDQGVFTIPDRFLATKAISYSTYGSARLANKPFTELFGPAGDAFSAMSFDGLGLVRTPQALMERLDTASCQGCHQSNATAGFHVIGEDDPAISPLNRVLIGVSPHFHAEQPRRRAYAEAMIAGREPNRFRPLPAAPPAAWTADQPPAYRAASLGLACLPAEARRHFGAAWTCAAGSACTSLASNSAVGIELGQCLTTERAAEFSGQACLAGRITTASAQPWRDRFAVTGQLNSRATAINFTAHTCRPPVGGAPAGLAYRKCHDQDRHFQGFRPGAEPPNEICGFAGGKAFDICVASNDFAACLGNSIVRGMRATCGGERFCREDFMCQALPSDLPEIGKVAGLGYCSPTYFLFQMRLDGHPDPRRRG
ncbi:hypothetical protein [Phreatobacter stygius]|uniref:hypothetical protein n=1 Tax=Phreatobacter stygius TaxID=1940610 RepID=UPI001FE9F43A|nr:hypothetical protein [Phreatobacter stygius]